MPLTRSASELQRNIGAIYELCHSTNEPVYITRNGQADLVVMDAQAFENINALQRLAYEREMRTHDAIVRGWEQAQAGELKSLSQIRAERDGQ